jgi:hypothetical protein
MNRVRDDFQQRLGQEAAPKRTSVQWEHNSLQRVTEKNWKVINQRVAVRIVRRISCHITTQFLRYTMDQKQAHCLCRVLCIVLTG